MWFLLYFSLHLIVYTLIRVEFLLWNRGALRSLSGEDIVWAFLNGIRFDLSALAVTVGLCFLGLIWLSRQKLQRAWILIFILMNAIFFLINFADIELFNFTAKRFSVSAFQMIGEGSITNYIIPYMGLFLLATGIIGVYGYLAFRLCLIYSFQPSLQKKALLSFIIVAVAVLFSRGGLQLKPLTFVDAKIFNHTYGNNLVLNSTFTILKSFGKNSLQRASYFETNEMLSLLNTQEILPVRIQAQKPNVMVIILESFSSEYLSLREPEATPFLNKLRAEGVDFPNSYANGRRSIEGVAAVLSGIPALMEEPFINSEFSANQIIGLGSVLAAQNYHTSFFHATANGSMHFDRFTKSVGIDNYFGLNEYPDKNDNDGSWGIYDEPFLQWTCKKLSEFKAPFFSTVFTLSSHQPYNFPEKYHERFKDDRSPILKTIRYTDYALEQFMKCAEKQPWFENTFFIVTADHTGPPLEDNSSFESRYKIPIVLYSPQKNLLAEVNAQQYAQHIDLLPTILDVLGFENKNHNYLARSLLRSGPKVIALYADGLYQLVGNVKNEEKQLKAIQQYFSEGLYDNRLYYPAR